MKRGVFIKPILFNSQHLQEKVEKLRASENASVRIQNINETDMRLAYTVNQQTAVYATKEAFNGVQQTDIKHYEALSTLFKNIAQLNTSKIKTTEELMQETLEANQKITKMVMEAAQSTSREQLAHYKHIQDTGKFISFDTETLGGTGKDGENLFDALVELAYTESEFGDQDIDKLYTNNTHKFLFGVDEKTYTKLLAEIESPNFLSTNRGRVIANRLAIYGNKKTFIRDNQIIEAADIGDATPTKAQMINGLNRLRAAHKDAQKTSANGLTLAENFLQTFYNKAQNNVVAGHNVFNFDNLRLGNIGYDMNNVKTLDTLTILRLATQNMSKAELFGVKTRLAQKTGLSQENVGHLLFGDKIAGMTKHNAGVDSSIHAAIVSDPLIKKALEQIKPGVATKLVPYNNLLYMNKSDYYDPSRLGFLTLPTGTTQMSDGISLRNGVIQKDSFKPGIIKKGGLYSYVGSGTLKLNPSEIEAMLNINADFAQKELFYLSFIQHSEEGDLSSQGVVTEVFRSKEAMENFIDSTVLMGERQNPGEQFVLPDNEADERAKQVLQLYSLKDNDSKELKLNTFIHTKMKDAKYDRASRKVRNHSLSDIDNLEKLFAEIGEKYKSALTSPVESLSITQGLQIAVKMQGGEVLTTDYGLKQMQTLLGRISKNHSLTEPFLYDNTIDNILNMSPFYFKNKNIIEKVKSQTETKFGKDSYQQAFAYKRIMQQLVDKSNVPEEAIYLPIEEMQYIQFEKDRIRNTRNATTSFYSDADLDERYMRIDLNKDQDFTFTHNLLKIRHGEHANKLRRNAKLGDISYDVQARAVLNDFAKEMHLKTSSKDYDDVEMFANTILFELKENKKEDPRYGIHQATRKIAIERGELGLEDLYGEQNIDELIGSLVENVPKVNLLNKNYEEASTRIINSFVEPIDLENLNDYFGKRDAEYTEFIYKQAKKEMQDFYNNMLKKFKRVHGLELMIDEEGKRLFAKHGSQTIELSQYIPKLRFYGGTPYLQVGNSQVAVRGGLFTKKNTQGTADFGTTVQKSIDNIYFSFNQHLKDIEKGEANGAESMRRLLSNFAQNIRVSPDMSSKTMMNLQSHLYADINDALGRIGILVKNKQLDVTQEQLEIINRFTEDGTKIADFSSTSQAFRSIVAQYQDKILAIEYGKLSDDDIRYRIAKHGGPFGAEGEIADRHVFVGEESHLPFRRLGPNTRITADQNNFYSFNHTQTKEAYEQYAKKMVMPHVRFNSNVQTQRGYVMSHTKLENFKQLDHRYSNQIVTKKMTVSHIDFKNTLEAYLVKQSDLDQKVFTALYSKLGQVSLLEDESFMDNRLQDLVFTQDPIQKIRITKDFDEDESFKELKKALDYKLETKDGKLTFSYGATKQVDKHDYLFGMIGYLEAEEGKLANYKGNLGIGFYSEHENIMLSAQDINKLIDGMDEQGARRYLDTLNQYFYIDRTHYEDTRKVNMSGVEKARARTVSFAPGEVLEDVRDIMKKLGLEGQINKQTTWKNLESMLRDAGATQQEIDRVFYERSLFSQFVDKAFNNQGIGIYAREKIGKHEGIDLLVRNTLLTAQRYNMENGTPDEFNAAVKVVKDFSDIGGFTLDIAPTGEILAKDTEEHFDYAKFKARIKELYGDNLEGVNKKETFNLVTDTVLAQTKEHDLLSARMPVQYLPSVAKNKKQMLDNEINYYSELKAMSDYLNIPLSEDQANIIQSLEKDEEVAFNLAYNKHKPNIGDTKVEDINKVLFEMFEKLQETQELPKDVVAINTLNRWQTEFDKIEKQIKDVKADVKKKQKSDKKRYADKIKENESALKEVKKTRSKLQSVIKKVKQPEDPTDEYIKPSVIDKIFNLNDEVASNSKEINARVNLIEPNNKEGQRFIKKAIELNKEKSNELNSLISQNYTGLSTALEETEMLIFQLEEAIANDKKLLKEAKAHTLQDSADFQSLVKQKQALLNLRTALVSGVANQKQDGYDSLLLKNAQLEKVIQLTKRAYNTRAKGRPFDERTFLNLRNKVYGLKDYEYLIKNATDAFKQTLKSLGLDAENAPKERMPLLTNAIQNMLYEARTTSSKVVINKNNLNEIDSIMKNPIIAKALKNIFVNNSKEYKDISYEMLEARYAIDRTIDAADFNDNKITRDSLVNKGFTSISLEEYADAYTHDSEVVSMSNSLFSHNLLVKIDDEEVALPFMPHTLYGDTFVQREYEGVLKRVKGHYFDYKDETDSHVRAELKTKITEDIAALKKQVKSMYSKEGPIANSIASIRAQVSLTAKSSTFFEPNEKHLTSFFEGKGTNYSNALRKAMHNGKSIADWIDEDVYLNVAFTSRSALAEMGYNDVYFSQFKDGDVLFDDEKNLTVKGKLTEKQIEHLLSTYGVEGLETRFPIIQEGSVTTSKLYLDTDLPLDSNVIKVMYAGQERKAGDNDGDIYSFMALRQRTNDNQMLDSIQQASRAMSYKYQLDPEANKGFNQSMALDAVGINRFLATKEGEKLYSRNERLVNTFFEDAIKKRLFGDLLIEEEKDNPYLKYSKEELAQMDSDIGELKESLGHLDFQTPDDIYKAIDELPIAVADTNNQNDIDKVKTIKDRYKNSVAQKIAIDKRQLSLVSKTYKTAIGEINLAALEMRSQAETLMHAGHINREEFDAVSALLYGNEQSVISMKNTEEMASNKIHTFKSIISGAYSGKEVVYNEKPLAASQAIKQFLDDEIKDEFIEKYAEKHNARGVLSGKSPEELYEMARDTMGRMLDHFNTEEIHATAKYFRQFTRFAGTAHHYFTKEMQAGLQDVEKFPSLKNTLFGMKGMDETAYFQSADVENMLSINSSTYARKHSGLAQAVQESMKKDSGFNAMLKTFQSDSQSGRGLAIAAIAGVGAYMLLGSSGASVTANTTNQAEQQEQYDTLSDYGSDYTYQHQAPQQNGYVINVSGKTPAKNVNNITQNFSSSMINSVSAQSTLTLNINELPIRDFQLAQIIEQTI